MNKRPQVVHFIRKNKAEEHFSLEFIFSDIRSRLKDTVDFKIVIAKRYSNGFLNRAINILDAHGKQGQVNHVTGDINYVNILFSPGKTILTILDCGFMNTNSLVKKFVFKLFWLTLPVSRAKYITTISYAAKSDIVMYTKCNPEKIRVIPVAVSELYKPVPKKFNEDLPIVLQVGTAPNKNVERVIQALGGINCLFVIVGKLYKTHLDLLNYHNIKYKNLVNLTTEELNKQYIECDMVTFISTSEGFGMPIIEANSVERPVIAGNNTSMPEVGGSAAYFVNAFSVEDIRRGIQFVISNQACREELIKNGRQNKLRFSSDAIAEMYKQLYYKAANMQL